MLSIELSHSVSEAALVFNVALCRAAASCWQHCEQKRPVKGNNKTAKINLQH